MTTKDYLQTLIDEELVGDAPFSQVKSRRTYKGDNSVDTGVIRQYIPLQEEYQFSGCTAAQGVIPQSRQAAESYKSWKDVRKRPKDFVFKPFTTGEEKILGMSMRGIVAGDLNKGIELLQEILAKL